ncbi:juvenile hormone acid O-methyltransferase-like [Tubulanus polymorphus]|uniref:juvenile hormone acid O-methyltransferase-like n=1 Tax=Tubulanus polymorphus TaxID=672921 RepID=UPI003DA31930
MNPTGQIYADNNDLQKKWAADILSSIEFRQNGYRNVLDIGCGSGEVTNTILNEINDVENVIAFDKNESMIEFARLKYPNPKIEYLVADVIKPDSFRPEWRQEFDLITSFFVLHWTPNQYSNLENIKSLLSPNGEIVFVLITSGDIGSISEVTKSEKWSPYFQGYTPEWSLEPGFEEYTEWRYPDAVTGYQRMAESLGFTVKQCTRTYIDYTHTDLQSAKGSSRAVLPHLERIPELKISEFMDDAFDLYLEKFPPDKNGKIHNTGYANIIHLQNKVNAR